MRAAFVLAVADRPEVGIEPVPSGNVFRVLRSNTHRRRAMEAMGQRDALFRALAAMARQAPVARVTRPRRPFLLDALADRVEAHLRRAGSAAGAQGVAEGALEPPAIPAKLEYAH